MKSVTNYILRSDGEAFARNFKVKSIVVLHEANRISRAKILLLDGNVSDQDFSLSNTDFFIPGRELEIDIGFENDVQNVFKGIIVRHGIKVTDTNTSTLEIECKHQSVKLTLNKKNSFFYNKSDKQIVEQILSEESIDFQILDWPEYTHEQVAHYASTNWDYIVSRADTNGLLVFTDEDGLIIGPPDLDQEEVLNCEYGSNVMEFEACINNEYQTPKVKSKAWSPDNQGILVAEGTPSFTNALGNLDSAALAEVWGKQSSLFQHTGNITEDELTAWSNAKATKNELAKIIGRVRVKGTHEVQVGKVITLSGFGDRFVGKALATGIRHELQNGNWTVDIQFGISPEWFLSKSKVPEGASNGLVPSVEGCQIAVVTQLEEDPLGSFRVKVKIPIIDDEEEGLWARLVRPYAGDGYGHCFYPEIGDEVIVGFLSDDPRHAFIIGAVHSSARPAPESATDDNHLKGIYTRSGLKMTFDDDQKIIEIATPSGNIIKIDESGQTIKITDEHSNFLEMKSDGITLDSKKDINIKAAKDLHLEGVNIALKASGKFEAEGTAGADVKSSAIAVLKGSLVQIN
ncbi:MAG: type VI secretion system tip protein VgrG [Pricia sp.]